MVLITRVLGLLGLALAHALPLQSKLSQKSALGLVEIQHGSYFVEFHSEPATPACEEEHAQFIKQIRVAGINVHMRNSFRRLFNGVAIDLLNGSQLQRLAALPTVKRTWPMQMRSRSTAIPSSNVLPNLMFAHKHTGVDKTHKELGLDGTGVKVGVIDTGVDYLHPDLGGCWKTPGCPFQFGSDFVGDGYDSGTTPYPHPGPYPRDTCDGHGTHVAGIIAAKGDKVKGVAPGVTLGVYRIFGCPGNGTGQAADDVILKAMEAAHSDHMDVINMSFGGGSGWSEDPLSVAAARLVRDGIVMVASAGNDGANGLYTSGSPGLGVGVINVASFENWMTTSLSIDLIGRYSNMSIVHSSPGNSKHRFVFELPVPVVAPTDSAGSNEGCTSYNSRFDGQIVLLKRGNCTFVEKAAHAQDAGAAGVMVYNYDSELMSPSSASANLTIPLVIIKAEDGQAIIDELKNGSVTASATNHTMSVANPLGGQVSHFSSWGPDPELQLSPAVGAPGGNIFSTFPLALGGYTSLSGTSMASPYVAGMAALILQSRAKKVSTDEVRQLILESAHPIADKNSTGLLSPLRQGSGLADIWDAVSALAIIEPPQLSLNYTVAGDVRDSVRVLTLHNSSPTNFLACTMTHIAASSVSSYMTNGSFAATPRIWPESPQTHASRDTLPNAYIDNSTLPIRVAPGASQEISVHITAPTGLRESDRWFYSGYLQFNLLWDDEVGTARSLHIPYMGYLGNYTQLDVLSAPDEGFPYISVKGSTDTLGDDAHVTINGTHRVAVHYRLEHPTRLLKIQLVDDANVTQGYLPRGYLEYMGRNYQSSRGHYSNSTINGTLYKDTDLTKATDLENGMYRVRIDALRPLRDPQDPEGYQIWHSSRFIIDSVSLDKNMTASKLNDDKDIGDKVFQP
ncbi:subtilisin-like protein [Coemansia reversa NRRL 1564]|uniref:Subtilisin-like protein n=1 Tax=Coemansia reversa (strain ATCC 12441 / NRRL 1564) TaxID=763665 RepID=A0A2G5B408_COERN|nr:subtilisin-like protein [Coemansia reversa NRRL 1564]|eukprot:PIA13467.1 subtilisin-like protein [Coemansia reversa NRRL 1564]